MRKFLLGVSCLVLAACFQTYDASRNDAAGLMKNDAFMRHTNPSYVSNENTIALISGVSNSLLMAPFYTFANYENRVNGMGYSKHYEYGDNVFSTVFAYHMRIPAADMPTDIKSDAFDKVFKAEVANLQGAEGRLYKNIKAQPDTFVTIHGINKSIDFRRFAYRANDMRANNLDVMSVMYLTVYNGSLLKVCINYPAANKEIGDKLEQLFMQELVANLADFDGNVSAFESARNLQSE